MDLGLHYFMCIYQATALSLHLLSEKKKKPIKLLYLCYLHHFIFCSFSQSTVIKLILISLH